MPQFYIRQQVRFMEILKFIHNLKLTWQYVNPIGIKPRKGQAEKIGEIYIRL